MQMGWIDFSKKERGDVTTILRLLGTPSALDEIGIGTIRDGFSNRLFPGLLTQQTRAKYFVLIATMILDIDGFRCVNDQYGHSAGDQVLREIARLTSSILCEHCQYYRWGGEEFMVLMQCEQDPLIMVKKVRACLEQSVIAYEGADIHVTVSIGVCLAEDIARVSIAQVINQADKCLYELKKKGKNCVTFAELM